MFQTRSIQSSLSFRDKLFSIDYVLVFSILFLGVISMFAMYSTDGGEFKYHTKSHIIRFLVFFLYLNDNEGGETMFPDYDIKVQPKAGRMLMFPPNWTHKHKANKPINQPKYILGSYLHYA